MNRRAPRVGASLRQLLHWGLANTLKQKFDLENALVRDKLGGDAATLPFGSTVVNVHEVVPAGGWGRLAPLLLAAVTGGLCGAALAAWCTRPAALPPPFAAKAPPQAVQPPAAAGSGSNSGHAAGSQSGPSASPTPGASAGPAPGTAPGQSASPARGTAHFLDGILEWEFRADEHTP